ncbi:MAG: hypothetical protein ACXAAI_01595 [Promethearchaeota archaeon]
MVIIEEGFTDSLNRVNFIFMNESVTTECIKGDNGFTLLGQRFGPFEQGKKYKLKLFSALPFIKNDILKIAPSEKCDNIDVQRYAMSERDDQKLNQTNDGYFLNRIREFRQFMIEDIEKKKKPQISLDRYNSYASSIMDNRLLKILKLTKSDLSMDDERRLTSAEKLLYRTLSNLIKKWRGFYLERD